MKFKTIAEAFNYYRNATLEEIERRAAEIKGTIETDAEADITTLNIELSGLAQAKENIQQRRDTESPAHAHKPAHSPRLFNYLVKRLGGKHCCRAGGICKSICPLVAHCAVICRLFDFRQLMPQQRLEKSTPIFRAVQYVALRCLMACPALKAHACTRDRVERAALASSRCPCCLLLYVLFRLCKPGKLNI